jgi:uncharacterized protein (DUF58 family)
LELTPTGRLIGLLGASLLVAGFLLFNTLIILLAVVLLLYLLFEGISFRHGVGIAKGSIKLESHPSRVETAVGRQVRIETLVTNHSSSRFQIGSLNHDIPVQIDQETTISPRLRLEPNATRNIEAALKAKLSGNFELTTSTILLGGRGNLFMSTLQVLDNVTIIAQPLVSGSTKPIETSALTDLAVDHLRRGTGTDLAGIRPSNYLDDFHRIDWKATARTGKLMTRESYLEREPTIMMMVDVSPSMSARTYGSSILEQLLGEVGNLLGAILPSSSIGLVLYNGREVTQIIEASQGVKSRERILRAILQNAKPVSIAPQIERPVSRAYADLARETKALMTKNVLTIKTAAYWERFSSFASSILPFYERAESNYLERVRRQGGFKAFEFICALSEPVLVIVISDGTTCLEGLTEGAKNARMLNHQVVFAFLTGSGPTKRIEASTDLEDQGVGMIICSASKLSSAINAEILKLSHRRTIAIEPSP